MSILTDDFDAWWAEDGRMYDPDTEDVPWYDKRKDLAQYAYERGKLVTTRWQPSYHEDDDMYIAPSERERAESKSTRPDNTLKTKPCKGCGYPIAEWSSVPYCGECLCEEDCEP